MPGGCCPPTTAAGVVAVNASAAYRIFVVEAAHPVEVEAAQQEHLLRWLSKRLGRQLTAPDLSKFGYRLMGGRLLPAGGVAAAQLMYDDAKGNRLTLYVQAEHGTETAFRFRQEGDTGTFVWIDGGFGFAVTAMASRDELLPDRRGDLQGPDAERLTTGYSAGAAALVNVGMPCVRSSSASAPSVRSTLTSSMPSMSSFQTSLGRS